MPGFEFWLKSERRRQYERTEFDHSGKAGSDVLNTYKGLGVTPQPGDWSLMQAHLFDNVCRGHFVAFRALLSFMAQLVQEPGRKLGSALVLRGVKGCGKLIVSKWLSHIVGEAHALTMANPRHLTGNFNAHFAKALLVTLVEGFWAGDHTANSVIRTSSLVAGLCSSAKGGCRAGE